MRNVDYLVGILAAICAIQPVSAEEPITEPPPLPFHTIEGVGGGAITPMAYLANPGPAGEIFGKPAAAFSYVNMGSKNLDTFTITETLFRRVEIGYSAERLGLGRFAHTLHDVTGVNIGHNDVWLHNINVRALLIEEGSPLGGLPMPAVTAGVHVKINDRIREVDDVLGGAVTQVGMDQSSGVDFTLTATKAFQPDFFGGRPLMLTGGVRASQGAQLGFLGFDDEYHATFEGNVVWLPADHLVLAYEFRGKPDPYGQIPGLIGGEDSWHGFDVGFILNEHSTFVAGYGMFGTLVDTRANNVWWLQMKYEF